MTLWDPLSFSLSLENTSSECLLIFLLLVVGDLNIVRDAIDHCEPSEAIRSAKEAGLSSFKETTQPRRWLDSMLQPLGPLHDVGREVSVALRRSRMTTDPRKRDR